MDTLAADPRAVASGSILRLYKYSVYLIVTAILTMTPPSTGLGLSGMPDYITKCLTNAELFNELLCKQRFSSSRCTNRSLTKMLQAHNKGLFTVRSEVRLAIVVHIIGEIPILHKPLVDSKRCSWQRSCR